MRYELKAYCPNLQSHCSIDTDNSIQVTINSTNICPCCSTGVREDHIASYLFCTDFNEIYTMFSLFFCPVCQECFLMRYKVQETLVGYSAFSQGTIQVAIKKSTFSDNINKISPKFISIYNQSKTAELSGLNEICGIGYRKALEFLVKDYSIYFNPNKKDEIEPMLLSQCIKNYIPNEHIKTLATASVWLGNDETHYVRKHENYNVEHMKSFIQALVSYIDLEFNYLLAKTLLESSSNNTP